MFTFIKIYCVGNFVFSSSYVHIMAYAATNMRTKYPCNVAGTPNLAKFRPPPPKF